MLDNQQLSKVNYAFNAHVAAAGLQLGQQGQLEELAKSIKVRPNFFRIPIANEGSLYVAAFGAGIRAQYLVGTQITPVHNHRVLFRPLLT